MTLADLRFALRRLHRHFAVSLAAVLTLALGIGAVTALFSVVQAVLLRPPPFRAPAELVSVGTYPAGRPENRFEISYPDFRDWRARSRSFQDLAAYQTALGRVVWESGGEPVPAAGFMVSGHLFDLLGARAALGRTLEPADDRPGAGLVVVLSDATWRREFAASPEALGRTVRLDGVAHTVIGVMPPEFDFPRAAGFWRGSSRRWTRWSTSGRSASSRSSGACVPVSRRPPRRRSCPAWRTKPPARFCRRISTWPPASPARRAAHRPCGPVLLVLFGATALVLVIAA